MPAVMTVQRYVEMQSPHWMGLMAGLMWLVGAFSLGWRSTARSLVACPSQESLTYASCNPLRQRVSKSDNAKAASYTCPVLRPHKSGDDELQQRRVGRLSHAAAVV